MRRAARVDDNQAEIVKALRMAGMKVKPTHMVGDGFADIVVGYRGRNVLLEIKEGAGKLTAAEVKFHQTWPGQIAVVRTPDEAVDAVLRHAQPQDKAPN